MPSIPGFEKIRRNLCESLEKTESTDLSVSQDKDKSSHSENTSRDQSAGDVFSTPWTAATRFRLCCVAIVVETDDSACI